MNSIIEKKTWGEREGVTLELLGKFTKEGCQRLGTVQQVWAYRGDCTETGDQRIKAAIGEEAYQHHHWNAVACNGGVLVVVPRWKFEEGRSRGEGIGLKAQYWWAMAAIVQDEPEEGAGVRPCTTKEIEAVALSTQKLLGELPGLEYMHVSKLSYYSTAKPGKKQWDKAPTDARYFRFAAGYGCVAITPAVSKAKQNARS